MSEGGQRWAMESIWVKNGAVWTRVRAAKKDIKELQSILKGELKGTAAGLHGGWWEEKESSDSKTSP